MLTIIEQLHAPATVQTEKLGGQTAVLSEDATESSVMPVRHGMLDQHLCEVMPVLKRALENRRPCHARRSLVERIEERVVPEEHTPHRPRESNTCVVQLFFVAQAGRRDVTDAETTVPRNKKRWIVFLMDARANR